MKVGEVGRKFGLVIPMVMTAPEPKVQMDAVIMMNNVVGVAATGA